jgi:hypothetical protein
LHLDLTAGRPLLAYAAHDEHGHCDLTVGDPELAWNGQRVLCVNSGTIRPTPIATADAPIPVRHHASHVRSAASQVRLVTSEFCGVAGSASGGHRG